MEGWNKPNFILSKTERKNTRSSKIIQTLNHHIHMTSIFIRNLQIIFILSLVITIAASCTTEKPSTETKDVAEELEIYIPNDLKENDFESDTSRWSYKRSESSDHFIVFWAKGYGDLNPGDTAVEESYRVNIDSLLIKAEEFYALNIGELKFAETGEGKSKLDQYKMMIFLFYQKEWMATGSGYDDVIGALWVSPNTCQPVGGVIGHEIGHSFQYQVFCDLGGDHGFRYGFGKDGSGGNGFWEQTAQWQSFQAYPELVFKNYHFKQYNDHYFKHVCHEDYRYASYFIHYFWADKHGHDFIGKLWRGALKPEDPIQAYMRITEISVDQMNDEMYEAASKFVTWDLPALKPYAADFVGSQSYAYTTLEDGVYQVDTTHVPGTTGYNVIPLELPKEGQEVKTLFEGKVNAEGFNTVADPTRAGWRYGYVALLSDGTTAYSEMNKETSGTATYSVPENAEKLWLVVTGAPTSYIPHPWDDDNSNDDQWPYQLSFENTDMLN